MLILGSEKWKNQFRFNGGDGCFGH
jgi:hypothetical protein